MSKSVAIMQPYFLPYIGYFQLINIVDTFVVYDNIKYTKKGWINRNRMLTQGKPQVFTIPLSKGSDYLNIIDRSISYDFNPKKLILQFSNAYKAAPYFDETFSLIEQIVSFKTSNLFDFIFNSIVRVCAYMNIKTPLLKSSELEIDYSLKSQTKVIAICKTLKASKYINPIGGIDLYNESDFFKKNLKLEFLQTRLSKYDQLIDEFIPNLSIIDVLMFNPKSRIDTLLNEFSYVKPKN